MAEVFLSQSRKSPAGIVAAIVLALLLAAELARLTVASAVAEDNPPRAARLAPAMPAALAAQTMAEVGQAAATGANPGAQTLEQLRTIAEAAPLRTEPFLVEAALAERAGKYDRAEQLLGQARLRDPRSAAARYLYADVAIREGKVVEGLTEMAVLSRLLPGASIQLVPALAQFARVPGARDKLLSILGENPQLKSPLLTVLAADPSNADLVLALAAQGTPLSDSDRRRWQSRLVGSIIAHGQYQQAYELWRRIAGLQDNVRPLVFNGDFRPLSAPQPFNWDVLASNAGFAELSNGNLRVLYYGRDDAILASELLVLPAGNYRFEAPVTGQLVPQALAWTLSCVGNATPLVQLQLAEAGRPAATFTVPASNCPAQRLQLVGQSQEMPQDSDVRLGPLQMERIGG